MSPDTAGQVLEVFYDVVETAAQAEKHDILVKRLGDGLFLTWGFKLAVLELFGFVLTCSQVERSESAKKLPVIAYAAALRIGEAVLALNARLQPLLACEAAGATISLRVGLTTGPALHGLLKTESLTSPDVIGAMVFFLVSFNFMIVSG